MKEQSCKEQQESNSEEEYSEEDEEEEPEELDVCYCCGKYIQKDDENRGQILVGHDYFFPMCGECALQQQEDEDDMDAAAIANEEFRRAEEEG